MVGQQFQPKRQHRKSLIPSIFQCCFCNFQWKPWVVKSRSPRYSTAGVFASLSDTNYTIEAYLITQDTAVIIQRRRQAHLSLCLSVCLYFSFLCSFIWWCCFIFYHRSGPGNICESAPGLKYPWNTNTTVPEPSTTLGQFLSQFIK